MHEPGAGQTADYDTWARNGDPTARVEDEARRAQWARQNAAGSARARSALERTAATHITNARAAILARIEAVHPGLLESPALGAYEPHAARLRRIEEHHALHDRLAGYGATRPASAA